LNKYSTSICEESGDESWFKVKESSNIYPNHRINGPSRIYTNGSEGYSSGRDESKDRREYGPIFVNKFGEEAHRSIDVKTWHFRRL
jgi:hypothetical protein